MTHRELVEIAGRWLRTTRHCGVVLLEPMHHGVEIPDAIGWKGGVYSIVVEAKTSRADCRRDAQKCHRRAGCSMGTERWFLAPLGVLSAADIPVGCGFIEWTGRIVRKRLSPQLVPQTVERLTHESQLLASELRIYHAQGITYRPIPQTTRNPRAETSAA
jgi:hypothetical protein